MPRGKQHASIVARLQKEQSGSEDEEVKFGDLSTLPSEDGSDSTYMEESNTSESGPYTFSSDVESSEDEIIRNCVLLMGAGKASRTLSNI